MWVELICEGNQVLHCLSYKVFAHEARETIISFYDLAHAK
jgi:hypothetical protein